jgi:dTDP-4-amino-4,6-dideoxygalactose transaminase
MRKIKMIPLSKPVLTGREIFYIQDSVRMAKISGEGKYSKLCEEFIGNNFQVGAGSVMLVPSGTAALELAAMLMDIEPGDEVIMPSFTFVSTANAFVLRGARPVFAEVREDTLNIDPDGIERLITPRTKAIVPVHYAGVGCEMNVILDIAKRRGLKVIEDAAQAVDATYDGKFLGTLGEIGCYSFHDTKNHTCGEGGAVVVNDVDLVDRAEILREKGTNRRKFFRGEVDKYSWVDVGSSYLLSDVTAAFLLAQLEDKEAIKTDRKRTYDRYVRELEDLEGRIELPHIPDKCGSNYHLFRILTAGEDERERLMRHLREIGVYSTFHYVPLHTSEMGKRWGYKEGNLPITEKSATRLLRLPLFRGITEDEQTKVIDGVKEFYR